jgi:hypothetical protein
MSQTPTKVVIPSVETDDDRHSADIIFFGPRSATDIHRHSEFLRHYMNDENEEVKEQDLTPTESDNNEALVLASSATRMARGETSPAFRLLHPPSEKGYCTDDTETDTEDN